jgi:PAS domain S-box-containing protein
MTWTTGQPVWSRDVTQEENFPRRSIAAEVDLKAGMAVPMLAGQDVVGVLEFLVFDERDEDEPILAFVSTISAHLGAIVRRKQLEEQLRRSEARHRIIVDTALDGIITMSADSVIRSFNLGAEGIFGYSAAEIIGEPLTRLMPERFRQHHMNGLQRYLQSREYSRSCCRGRRDPQGR